MRAWLTTRLIRLAVRLDRRVVSHTRVVAVDGPEPYNKEVMRLVGLIPKSTWEIYFAGHSYDRQTRRVTRFARRVLGCR